MAKKKKVPFNDLSGGINLRNSPDRINDNQFQALVNMASEGNKLRVISGYTVDINFALPGYLLMETGERLLLETGDRILTEGVINFV